MNNPNNLKQALEEVKREIEHETTELKSEELAFKQAEEENVKLLAEIRTHEMEIKKNEEENKKFKLEVDLDHKKINDNERKHTALRQKIEQLKREQQKSHAELLRTQQEYTKVLGESGVKIKS